MAVLFIPILAVNHACRLCLSRNYGVTVECNIGNFVIHTLGIKEPWGEFHEQLEGLATDLGLVVVKVLCDTDEVNTNTLLAITSKVPRGRQVVREVDA